MIEHQYSHRVRYEDVDRMGFVYHARYISYFEFARTELVRELGLSYREMEERGILLPVTRIEVKYRKPAHYDDLIQVRSRITEIPRRMLDLEQSVWNEKNEKLMEGRVILAFVNQETMRPMVVPEDIQALFESAWKTPVNG